MNVSIQLNEMVKMNQIKEFAPIVLFVYNRLLHVQNTVEALQRNQFANKSDLYIFSDGPSEEVEIENVQTVREYLKTINGFKSVTIIERDINLGLAQSIISGVTEIVNKYSRIIVLEDDLITSPFFLKFMNEALEFYKDEEEVISIHGYLYPVKAKLPKTFFLRGADCWGWATWKRGWDLFEPDGKKLLYELKARRLKKQFNNNGTYPYTKMLEKQIKGENSSWAIRWYASAFLKGKLTLYPGNSLIKNIGLDDSGTHCGMSNEYDTQISMKSIAIDNIPIQEHILGKKIIEKYFKSLKPSIIYRFKNRIMRLL